jgi:hypothetical protein
MTVRNAKTPQTPSLKLPKAILSRDSGNQAIRQSGNQAIRQSGNQAIRQSGNQAIRQLYTSYNKPCQLSDGIVKSPHLYIFLIWKNAGSPHMRGYWFF